MHGRLSRIHHDEQHAVRRDPAGLPRRPLPLARGRRRAAGAARDGLDAGRGGHGARASHAPAVRRPVPPRVRQHATRPGAARELPRPRPRSAPGERRPAPTATERAPGPIPAAPGTVALERRVVDAWCEPGGGLRRPVRRPRPRRLARQLPQRGGRRAVLVHRRARRAARPGRPATTSPRAPSPWSARPAASERAESVFDYCRRELAAAARRRARAAVRLRRRVRGLPRLRAQGRVRRPRHADLDAPRRRAPAVRPGRRLRPSRAPDPSGRADRGRGPRRRRTPGSRPPRSGCGRSRASRRRCRPRPLRPAACASRSTTRPTPTSSTSPPAGARSSRARATRSA